MRLSERQRECLDRIGVETFVLRRPAPEAEPDVSAAATVESAPAMRATAEDAPAWAELRAQVAVCTQCELHQGRTQTVFGVGNERAEWMLIGEAPGAEEDKQGEPFVGRAGQLLTSMIVAMGMRREDVFICNILKCRPPSNRDPKPEEAAACSGYLRRQIELVKPKIILAIGRIAAQNLLNTDTPIGKMRGRVYKHPTKDIPVIVTYHPAYLLRSPSEKRRSWQDLQFAMRVYRGEQ
jgi:DNA polymerase